MISLQPQSSDRQAAHVMTGVACLVAIGAMIIWQALRHQGVATTWDFYGIPLLAAFYLGAGVLHLVKPRWMALSIPSTLIATGIYLLGAIHLAMNGPSLQKLSALTSLLQLMPAFYVIAFVAWSRGGAWLSGITCAGLAAQYLWSLQTPTPTGGWSAIELMTSQAVLTALVMQPGCILALTFIVRLRGQLNRTQQEAFASKERFLAILSHEMRTPLQTMLGSIDLLALKLRGSTEMRALDRLRGSAIQLDTHLRDLTEFTRLENPDLRIQSDTFDLVRLLHDLRDESLALAQSKGLSLNVVIPDTDQVALQACHFDATRVRQIISNLVSNALKYTLVGGVTVRASLSAQRRGHLTLVVEDSGIGIAAQHAETVFEPYARLENARTLRVEGTGLGLAVVKRLVERLGGTIHLDSHPDRGSRFTVELPLVDNR